jgi:hypothetical protein
MIGLSTEASISLPFLWDCILNILAAAAALIVSLKSSRMVPGLV